MKILYCETLKKGNLATWSIHVFEVVTNLTRMGHEVVLLNNDMHKIESKIDIRQQSLCSNLKKNALKSRLLRPFAGYITILGLMVIELYVFFAALRLLAVQKPRIDVIYRRHNLFSSERILAKLFKIPSVREVNGIYSDEIQAQKRGDRLSLWILHKLERYNMPKADKIMPVTNKLKSLLQEEYGVPENKISVNPNAANVDLFKPMDTLDVRKELRLDPDDKYVCFVGNLVKWLGIDNLVNSAPFVVAELPDTRFLIVGDGELKGTLQNHTEALGIADKFIFFGMVPYERVPSYINAADVCVLPATADYRNKRMGASPLKLHEYMACGKPVVAGDIEGDIQEVAESGSGLVVDPLDAREMAAAIITLLKNVPLRQEMGQKARQIVVEKYSWLKNAANIAEVCQSVVNHR